MDHVKVRDIHPTSHSTGKYKSEDKVNIRVKNIILWITNVKYEMVQPEMYSFIPKYAGLYIQYVKGKAFLVQAVEALRVRPYAPAAFYPQENSW
jgi:hypothetical protein